MVDSTKETVKRRISKKDWDSVEEYIQDELKVRENSNARKRQTKIWKEVDRQVHMEGQSRTSRDKNADGDWRNSLELGELSRASEVIAADVRRITFPTTRAWFEPHSDLPPDENGLVNADLQRRIDGRQRAFMTQQQLDFGFKSRVDLSVKEALHHGSYVATVEWESAIQITDGTNVGTVASPVWKPHSMWNCYPDPSVGGNNTFYQGSMITKSYKPAYQVRRMKSPDSKYPFFNLNKIEKKTNHREQADDTDDIEIITYYGDLVIPRQSGRDILLLNSRAMLANGRIIHYMPNPFPYPPVIYNGWERLDVRDPYYVSPLDKFSVDQKIGSQLANRLLDNVDLKVEPPIIYDGNDPDFIMNGGPNISPGSKTPTKGSASYTTVDVGDPNVALSGLQWIISQIEAGTKVDRVRSGVSPGTEQTATEVVKQAQNAELSTIDFVDKHEIHGLRPYLYMADHLNRNNVSAYKFYNQELDSPDFETMKRSELPNNVHYEIVGSKGLLGEEQRQAATSQVTAFWMGSNPALLKQDELAKEMFRDAGNKNPEKFLNVGDEANALKAQFEQAIQQLQQEAQQLQQDAQEATQELNKQVEDLELKNDQLALDKDQKDIEKAGKDVRIQSLQEQIKLIKAEQKLEDAASEEVLNVRTAVEDILKQVQQPKKIIYDGTGKPIGVETVQ